MSDRIFLMNKGEIVKLAHLKRSTLNLPMNSWRVSWATTIWCKQVKPKQLFNIETEWKVAIRPESIYVKEQGRQYGEHISA